MIQTDLFERTVLPIFEQTRSDWLTEARQVASDLGRIKDEITIDDVRAICPPPDDVDPRVMGAVFKRSEWELIRHQRSTRSTCHNRPVGVFRLRKKQAERPF